MLGFLLLALFGIFIVWVAASGLPMQEWRIPLYAVGSLMLIPGGKMFFGGLLQWLTGWNEETLNRRMARLPLIVLGVFLYAMLVILVTVNR